MGRTKNEIQKPATVHLLQSGKWAVFVTLVTPRMLEGKMRSGRKKFERQTQALANGFCAEINALLFGKELARQLSQREQQIARKVFWEVLEPHHPEWLDHLVDIVRHAEKTGFRPPDDTVPTIAQAARIFYQEHMRSLEKETQKNYRYAIAYLLPKFGHLRTYEMADQQILQVAYGTDPLNYMRSTVKCNHTPEEAEAHIWDTLEKSKGKRPWSLATIESFLNGVRAFKSWMRESKNPVTQEQRRWCPKCTIEVRKGLREPTNPKSDNADNSDLECVRKPALTIPQVQALIDVAWVTYGGRFAPFYVHAFWCGSRAKEISRTDVAAFDSHDGVVAVSESAAKTDRARESEVYPNTITMVEALRFANLYTAEGLRPDPHQRTVIHILAGFASTSKTLVARAEFERKRLEARGVILPRYNWGIPFPRNALRRTALSMHYKLFLNMAFTTGWGGNSPGIFKQFYKRLVTKQEAREYWTILPTWLRQKAEIKIELPKSHKLDSAITEDVKSAVSAACDAMTALKQDVAGAAEMQRAAAKFRKRETYSEQNVKELPIKVEDQTAVTPEPLIGKPSTQILHELRRETA